MLAYYGRFKLPLDASYKALTDVCRAHSSRGPIDGEVENYSVIEALTDYLPSNFDFRAYELGITRL